MSEFGGLECFWSDLNKHPSCPHGPTLLFGKYYQGELKQFYACSACRDRKLCTFYAEKDAKLTEAQKKSRTAETKKATPSYNHRKLFIRFNESMVQIPERRAYCHTCEKLVLFAERPLHTDHDIQTGLSDEEMNNPTTILKPLSNVKKEAQYMFSKKATDELTNILVKAGAQQVLCIGAPKIHEHITQNFGDKVSSILLDFDGRFHNFLGPLSYCWYNLFNHHFFTDEAAQTYRDFVTQNNGKQTFLICDPPFGGRVESISQTIKTITDQHTQWNNIEDNDLGLKIVFVFPYFMESIMRQKSNPPGIEGGLKNLVMSDYKVDYENHPLFVTGSKGRKHGSPVRIFTNIGLKILQLPTVDGYKYCGKCEKWVSAENKHCKRCKACTSKDGRRYKHCERCQRCVKPTWKHCNICERCTLERHKCGEKPIITGLCFKCGGKDHIGKNCEKFHDLTGKSLSTRTSVKRKNAIDGIEIVAKKQKSFVSPETRATVLGTTLAKVKKAKNVDAKRTKITKFEKTKIITAEKMNGNLVKREKLSKSKVRDIGTIPEIVSAMKTTGNSVKGEKVRKSKVTEISTISKIVSSGKTEGKIVKTKKVPKSKVNGRVENPKIKKTTKSIEKMTKKRKTKLS